MAEVSFPAWGSAMATILSIIKVSDGTFIGRALRLHCYLNWSFR